MLFRGVQGDEDGALAARGAETLLGVQRVHLVPTPTHPEAGAGPTESARRPQPQGDIVDPDAKLAGLLP